MLCARKRRRGSILSWTLVLPAVAAGCGWPAAAQTSAPAPGQNRNILILYSAQFGLPGYDRTNAGLWPTLRSAGMPADALFSEYLDLGRNPDPAYRDRLAAFLKQKYADRKIGVIIAISTSAASFVLDERYRLFEGVPVIAAIPSLSRLLSTPIHPLVVLGDRYDIAGTLQYALDVLPATESVLVVNGVAAFDKVQEASAREQLKPWESRLRISYLSGLPADEMLRHVSAPLPKTVILYLGVFQDAAGRAFIPDDFLHALAPVASAPIFTIQDGWIDAGVVGGSMTSFQEDGVLSARLALRILNGEPLLHTPSSVIPTPNRPIFNWRQLKRWGLDEAKLPPNSLIVAKPVGIWKQHPVIALVTVTFLALESVLIVALLWHRRQKRIAMDLLFESEEKFRKFFTNVPDYCYIVSPDGIVRDANRSALAILGYTREELIGRAVKTIYAPRVQPKVDRLLAQWQQSGGVRNEEMVIVAKDGGERTVLLNSAAIRDSDGAILFSTSAQTDITERKQAEEALRKSEAMLRQAEELGQFGSASWDLATDATTWSDGLYRIAGRDPSQPAPRHAERAALYTPESWARLDGAVRRAMASGEPYDMEVELIRPDGVHCWAHVLGAPVRDDTGRIVRLYGTLQDITASKQAGDALRQARQSLEALIQSTDDLIWSVDTDYRMVTFNNAIQARIRRLYGVELAAGAALEGILPPEIAGYWRRLYDRAMRKGSFKTERQLPDGGILELVLNRISDGGNPIGISVFAKDITERKRAEDALRESEERFRSAFDFAAIGMALVAPDGRWLRVNQSICRIVGYAEEELLARDFQSITHPEDLDTDLALARQLLDGSLPYYHLEKRYIHKDGRAVWILLSVSLVRDSRGGPLYFIAQIQDITERKEGERKLLREKTFNDAIIDNVPGLFYLIDERGKAVRWNHKAEEITGYSPAEGSRMQPVEFFPSADRAAMSETLRRVFIEGHAEVEADLVLKNGATVPFYLSAARVRFQGESYLIGNGIDISARKKAEQALRDSEAKFSKAFQNSPITMTISTMDEGRYVEVNNTFERITGWRRDEVMGRRRGEFRIWSDVGQMKEAKRRLLAEGGCRDLEFGFRTKSGERRVSLLSAETIEFGGETCILTVGQDITEQKGFERQLRRLNESLEQRVKDRTAELERAVENLRMLSQAIENGPAIVVITDPEGQIEYVNPKFCEATGYTKEEAVAKRPGILKSGVHPPEFYEQLWSTIRAGETWRGEFCNRRKNGDLYWESACISTVRDALGQPRHYVAIKEDITELKQAAEELKRAKDAADAASRAKTAFLASMSHEIRTPLHAILGYSQLMLRDASISPQTKENLRIVNRSGEHLLALITDVLEMSKIESGRVKLDLAEFDVEHLLRDLAAMFRLRTAGKGIGFSVVQDKGMPRRVVGDGGKVRQILINLLGNAVKFTEAGHIALRAAVGGDPQRPALSVEVEDTGAGIAASEMGKLFQAFEQTHSGRQTQSGTGLGLAISREYARLMGGDISVASELGTGSTFRLKIPIEIGAPDMPADTIVPGVAGLAPGQDSPRVLLADDDESNRGWLARVLGAAGFDVRESANGREAVAMCNLWKPRLVLMDIHMPEMDGCDATRRIKASPNGAQTVVVALTANALDDNRVAAYQAGVDDFLIKPLREPDLFQKIATHLGIRYRYAETSAPEPDASICLNPASLTGLPLVLRDEMRQAILTGDMDRFTRVLPGVAERDPSVADGLRQLADRYDYDALAALLQ